MSAKQSLKGPGQFQWNRGGWLGSQIGGTAWLLVGGVIALYQAPLLGVVWILLGLALNLLGWWLWNQRDRQQPFQAILMFLAACGVTGMLALLTLELCRSDLLQDRVFRADGRFILNDFRRESLKMGYAFFLIGIPIMMAYFTLMERAARKHLRRQVDRAAAIPVSGEAHRPQGIN